MAEPYYFDQSEWGEKDYYALHRYMHRMIFNKDRKMAEIDKLDPCRMTEQTRVLLYCIIKYYGMDDLLEHGNLSQLKGCKPLEKPLVLDTHAANRNSVYAKMNVIF